MASMKLAAVSDIPEGGMIVKEHAGTQIMLAKVGGAVHAMNDVCTHKGAPLHDGDLGGPEGKDPYLLTCPLHAAQFDVRTGKVHQDTPWATDTRVWKVEVRDGDVYVEG